MGKHQAPPFKMIIERGRMVPATAYDAERLDSYTNNTRVNVHLTEDKDRVLVRKWWAILGRAVKECKTPWQNKDQASEAIKLALGIVNLSKTVGGDFMAYPKSLTELDDPDLSEAVNQMIDVIYNVTGVDPSVWRKHVENIRDDEPEPSATVADEAPADNSPPPSAGAPTSEEPCKAAAETAPSPDEGMPIEDAAWLLSVARQLWAATGKGEQELVGSILKDVRSKTPESIGKVARKRAQDIVKHCKAVCFGEADASEALERVAGVVGVEPKAISADGGSSGATPETSPAAVRRRG